MRRFYFLCWLIPCLSFVSFDEREPFAAFREWYNSNKHVLVFHTDFDGLNYQLRYNPAELKLMSAIVRDELKGKKELREWYKKNDSYDEFSFKIFTGTHDPLIEYSEDKKEYNEKLFYLLESARYDFSLIRESDTITPVHYQFENNYGNAPFISMYVVFKKATKNNPVKEFLFNDQLFGKRVIPIDIHQLNNLNVPKIK